MEGGCGQVNILPFSGWERVGGLAAVNPHSPKLLAKLTPPDPPPFTHSLTGLLGQHTAHRLAGSIKAEHSEQRG